MARFVVALVTLIILTIVSKSEQWRPKGSTLPDCWYSHGHKVCAWRGRMEGRGIRVALPVDSDEEFWSNINSQNNWDRSGCPPDDWNSKFRCLGKPRTRGRTVMSSLGNLFASLIPPDFLPGLWETVPCPDPRLKMACVREKNDIKPPPPPRGTVFLPRPPVKPLNDFKF